MSSVAFRQIGKHSNLTGLVRSLAAEYQKFVARSITIETTDFRAKHRSTQSLLKYNELAIQSSKKPVTTQFYMPYEPDFQNVVLMLNLDQMGRYAIDSSGFGNHGKFAGAGYAPQQIMDDGIDLGFGENSQYFHFDGMYSFVFVEDSPLLQAVKVNTSICFTFRIYLMAHSWTLSDPNDASKPRYIFAKSDDRQQQNGYACAMDSTGNIRFTWVRHGIRTTIQTGSGVIATKNPGYSNAGYTTSGYDTETVMIPVVSDTGMEESPTIATFQIAILANVAHGYDPDGYDSGFITGANDDFKIAVDSAFLTQSATPVITYYSTPSPDHLDLFVGNQEDIPDDIDDPNAKDKVPNKHENLRLRIGAAYPFTDSQQGWYKWHGGIQAFRIYRDLLLQDGDLQYLFSNHLSIAGYPFGQIALAGYTEVLPTAIGVAGYSATGYDNTGFDTGLP